MKQALLQGSNEDALGVPRLQVLRLEGSSKGSNTKEEQQALVDSGATHAMRPPSSNKEWSEAASVAVQLAGSQTTDLKMSNKGTQFLELWSNLRERLEWACSPFKASHPVRCS